MRFIASEFHRYYQLHVCGLRIYLRERGMPMAEPDAYHKLLERLGDRHEKQQLAQLGPYFDAQGDLVATRNAVERAEPVIYQPAFQVSQEPYGEVFGIPDFLILDGDAYRIRDAKLARRFSEEAHPEILRQLELYGWLYERTFGKRPVALEAYMGDQTIHSTPYEPSRALAVLLEIQALKQLRGEPYDPIGWSKCLDCAFTEFCWTRARQSHDVALLPSVNQALARTLRTEGILTYDQLLEQKTEETLREVKKQTGKQLRKVGKAAARILLEASAWATGKMTMCSPPQIPTHPSIAVFDVEGIPPHLEHAEKTYLWGLKVFGERPTTYMRALAPARVGGDEEGWRTLLRNCQELFREYGDLPLLCWSKYEQTQVKKYIDKFGDGDGVAARILANLCDLLPSVQESAILPIPSYGLKIIEQCAGYVRKMADTGGKWSMATYIEAVETQDANRAAALIEEICRYNEEDLDALWAVYLWIKGLGPAAS